MRDRYRLTPAFGWKCAGCDLVVLEHGGSRVPRCACGSELWSERVRVAVPQRLAELSRFTADDVVALDDTLASVGRLPVEHIPECPRRILNAPGICSETCRKARGV